MPGTAREPRIVRQIGCDVADDEERVCALELPTYWFVNVSTPNAKSGLAHLDEQMAWDACHRALLSDLSARKPVVTCGDFNVAHEEIDLRNPDASHENAGLSDQGREGFAQLLNAGFTDTFRARFPELGGAYSWWSYRMRPRERSAGWRIDYFLVSDRVADHVTGVSIPSEVFGSDHCPAELTIEL